jgi:two-component system, OmpR family, sensor histidine kinase VicK
LLLDPPDDIANGIEKTEVVQGIENIVKSQIEGLAKSKKQHDAICDQTFPASLLSTNLVWDMCLDLKRRGVQVRTITEITLKNIEHCKKMMTRMQLRHLDDIQGNFGIRDKVEYRGTSTMKEGEPPTEGILSTAKVFVDNQQYFFETLWNKAIPANQRIREIEEGTKREFVEVIRDSQEIQKL